MSIPAAEALDKGYLLGLAPIGGAAYITFDSQLLLQFKSCDYIGIDPITIPFLPSGVKGGKSGGQNDSTHLEALLFSLLRKVDGIRRAHLLAELTFFPLEMQTPIRVNHVILQGGVRRREENGAWLSRALLSA